MKGALELRKEIKGRKPKFLRQDAHKKSRLSNIWRAPKGVHSKMRLQLKSYRKSPSAGYSSPAEVKGLNHLGLNEVLVRNMADLDKIKESDAIVLSGTLGVRKKVMILQKVKELKLKISNIKDIDKYLKDVENLRKEKKKDAKKKGEHKKKSKEESLKKAEEKKKEEEKKDEDSKDKEGLEKAIDEEKKEEPVKIEEKKDEPEKAAKKEESKPKK